MSLAFAIIWVDSALLKQQSRIAVQEAQAAADKRFEAIAIDNRLTHVLRNPEPRVMSFDELRKYYPLANLDGVTGLYFTADIT